MPPVYSPMLATTGWRPHDLSRWAAEPKLDGWRSLVSVDEELVVRSRRGRHLTDCVPELRPLEELRLRVVLDGELIVGAGRLDDFYALSARLSGKPRSGSPAVVFVAFDVLWHDGEPVTTWPYEERRKLLESLTLGPVRVAPSYPGEDADALLDGCEREGMEGLVLKRLSSVYRPGERSRDWVKVKCTGWREHLERRRPS